MEAVLKNESRPRIWMHCASLGEFEQGRPVLEGLRARYPQYCFVLTFFSPSGYEVRKNYDGADYVFYLPADGRERAEKFIDLIQPQLVLWVKYDYWYYYLVSLQKKDIPVLLISAHFRKNQPFFHWYGGLHRRMLQTFRRLFVQSREGKALLSSLGLEERAEVSGDTRFDRVLEIAANFTEVPGIEKFCGDRLVVVAGSTWKEDVEELDHFANEHPEIAFLIAPHEIEEEDLRETEILFKQCIRYSAWLKNIAPENSRFNVLIIDNVGMLARLYKYGTFCYIGGGFGEEGVHNVLEAAVYGKPVIFGPVYDEYAEAVSLVEAEAAFSIESALELEEKAQWLLSDHLAREKAGKAAADYVHAQRGATNRILAFIQENRLLTSR